MPNNKSPTGVYEELAQLYDRTGQPKQRDYFLVLAADEALTRGHPADAERLRSRLLQNNPHHLLKPYGSFQEALQSPDVQAYVADLRRTYPPETAAKLLTAQRTGGKGQANPPQEPLGAEWYSPTGPEPVPFRLQQEAGDNKNRPNLPGSRPPARPEPAAARRPTAQPSRSPTPLPPGRGPLPVPLPRPEKKRVRRYEEATAGAWVPTGLFVILLLAGLALAAYTVASPFLPGDWLP